MCFLYYEVMICTHLDMTCEGFEQEIQERDANMRGRKQPHFNDKHENF